ncbi:uncharacterized protein MELLADRAFT_109235 [Melampsora larici-populina 98AG31]|uniref:Uncharacterized protein n=1 Tax=Melampsora larici-populina (strain 98AG31 / pathotype 3-4-7) TaxID=747676 RepID=F4RVT7_MELLP|nr:uncharacterized protein MELLADRAFT_109235 [Melampsora larici-populina 98AG31]EGG03525.1 hypothetical protein MELLADRAFT_109235 [Melampsora larici-populina 98AG31]
MVKAQLESGISGRRFKSKRDQILHDPFKGPPLAQFIKSSTIWDIWPSVSAFTLEAIAIAFTNRPKHDYHHGTGTSSAYAQYTEARRAWGSMIHHSRTLARIIWIHIPDELYPHSEKDPPSDAEVNQAILEKKTMTNLIESFSVSVKHYLRGERGIFYEDLYHLVCFLPKYNVPSYVQMPNAPQLPEFEAFETLKKEKSDKFIKIELPSASHQSNQSTSNSRSTIQYPDPLIPPIKLLPSYNPPKKTLCDHLPVFRIFRSLWKGALNFTKQRRRSVQNLNDDNLPLEILWQLDAYITSLKRRKMLDVPTTNSMNASIVGLSDALSTLERVLTTPLPFGYTVHLKTVIWGYLLFLPFQLIGTFKKITIPATALISFVFLGFLKISEDIENPFGYSPNDLDLDHFCFNIIAKEIDELTSSPPSNPSDYIFSASNLPLFNLGEFKTAEEIYQSMKPDELRNSLSRKDISSSNSNSSLLKRGEV